MSAPREIYADHAATTRPAAEVVEAMRPYFAERFGNASSVHRRGEAARDAIESARARVASLIGAALEEVVFTASGSEANNLALRGAMAVAASGRRRLVVSAIEHPSVLETARVLQAHGVELSIAPVGRDGVVDLAALETLMGDDVALVSLMAVNNETGVIQPVEAASRLAHAAGARLHVDAVQALGKLPVDVGGWGVDLLSLAGHKFHGPPGAAALFVRRRTRLEPLIHGGHQERSRRAGTEDLPAIVGLGVAAERAALGERTRVNALGARLLEALEAEVPGTRLHGTRDDRLPSILNVGFEGIDGEAMLHELDLEGITVSTGSACSAASPGPSHVLLAMGLTPEQAHASVRFSLGESNGEADVERIVDVVRSVTRRLRALDSPMERSA